MSLRNLFYLANRKILLLYAQQGITGTLNVKAVVDDPDGDSLLSSVTKPPQRGLSKRTA